MSNTSSDPLQPTHLNTAAALKTQPNQQRNTHFLCLMSVLLYITILNDNNQ